MKMWFTWEEGSEVSVDSEVSGTYKYVQYYCSGKTLSKSIQIRKAFA